VSFTYTSYFAAEYINPVTVAIEPFWRYDNQYSFLKLLGLPSFSKWDGTNSRSPSSQGANKGGYEVAFVGLERAFEQIYYNQLLLDQQKKELYEKVDLSMHLTKQIIILLLALGIGVFLSIRLYQTMKVENLIPTRSARIRELDLDVDNLGQVEDFSIRDRNVRNIGSVLDKDDSLFNFYAVHAEDPLYNANNLKQAKDFSNDEKNDGNVGCVSGKDDTLFENYEVLVEDYLSEMMNDDSFKSVNKTFHKTNLGYDSDESETSA